MKGTEIARLPGLRRGAEFSPDQVYRYILTREWGGDGKALNMIMLNPSVADTERDDRTICRVMEFAHREGFRFLTITNIFALRATSPKELGTIDDPVGPLNDEMIRLCASRADQVWVGWGSCTRIINNRMIRVQEILHETGIKQVSCLGQNSDGSPCHPLYQRGTKPLELWRGYF